MPEQSRTPNKLAQVAPAVSSTTTPNLRHANEPAEKLTNLKKDVLADSNMFPSIGGYVAEVEAEHLVHDAKQHGEIVDKEDVIDELIDKEEIHEKEKAAIPKPAGSWTAGSFPAKLNPEETKVDQEARQILKPDVLADSSVYPRLEKDAVVDSKANEKEAVAETNNAWQGKLPEAVKQPGEFHQAETVYVDEPAERAAGLARYKQQRKDKRMAMKTGPLRFFKGEPRETWLERKFVGGSSAILGVGISVICGVLRIFGLRDLSCRFVMGCRNFIDRVIEGTFLRHFRNYGRQWSVYRLYVRMLRNIDHNVREYIGPEPGKNVQEAAENIHREGVQSWETAKREAKALRDETADVFSEARSHVRKTADEKLRK